MVEVQILDDSKYEKALVLLYSMGGMFRTRPYHKLVVGPVQCQALVDAGLVRANARGVAVRRGAGRSERLGAGAHFSLPIPRGSP